MSRFDILKSYIRAGAERAGKRLEKVGPVAAARRFARELREQRTVIDDRVLTRSVAHVPGVSAASVSSQTGALHIDVSFDDGRHLNCALSPVSTRFAPRGAKEVVWRVAPASAMRHPGLRDVVSAIAGVIAHHLWAVVLGREHPDDVSGAIVDRDGDECLRIDLRTVPAVRSAMRQRTGAMVTEVLELRGIEANDGALTLSVKLPIAPI